MLVRRVPARCASTPPGERTGIAAGGRWRRAFWGLRFRRRWVRRLDARQRGCRGERDHGAVNHLRRRNRRDASECTDHWAHRHCLTAVRRRRQVVRCRWSLATLTMMVSLCRFPRDLRHWLSTICVAMPQAGHITAGQHEPRQEHSDNESDQPTICHAYSLNG